MTIQGTRYYIDVEGRSIELPEGEATVGRSRNCTVAVKDVTVSRHHATICFEGGRAKVRDLGSSNGTFVNGQRVDGEIPLADGDRVVVGEAELVLRMLAPLGPAEATARLVIPPMSLGESPLSPGSLVTPAGPSAPSRATHPPARRGPP